MGTAQDDYEKVEKQKRINDIKYIQSASLFKQGIEAFFKAYGKTEMSIEDLYIDDEGPKIRKLFNSNFVNRFLRFWVTKEKTVYLSKALKIIEIKDKFEYFRAKEIVDYNFKQEPDEKILIEIARDYFIGYLPQLNFTNCIIQKKDKFFWQRKQLLIGELFETFSFDAPSHLLMELVWLDQGGTLSFETSEHNNRKSLSQKILEKLSEDDLPLFKQKITENLKLGIHSSGVLGNHLGLCKHLKIYEAKTRLANIITGQNRFEISNIDLLNIYIELGGDVSHLLKYFKKIKEYNSYTYFHFVSKFIQQFSKKVHASLVKCMNSITTTVENKIKAAQYLCELGDMNGFVYLANEIRLNKVAPYSIQSFYKLSSLDTCMALKEIRDLAYLLIDPVGTSPDFTQSAGNILREWLQSFASKSENDLNAVIKFYNEVYEELKDKYDNAKLIFWYEEQAVEKF